MSNGDHPFVVDTGGTFGQAMKINIFENLLQ